MFSPIYCKIKVVSKREIAREWKQVIPWGLLASLPCIYHTLAVISPTDKAWPGKELVNTKTINFFLSKRIRENMQHTRPKRKMNAEIQFPHIRPATCKMSLLYLFRNELNVTWINWPWGWRCLWIQFEWISIAPSSLMKFWGVYHIPLTSDLRTMFCTW